MSQGTESRNGPTGRPRVGLICNDGHSVFAEVADRVERRGATVRFFEPGRLLSEEELSGLSLLMNKKVDPASFAALTWADRNGVPSWNGYRTMLLGMRLVGYRTLEHVGCRVPSVSFEKPAGDYVAKTFADWHFQPDPELNGDGDIYQRLVPTEPIDYKYYAVATGTDVEVRVLRTTSKLHGEKEPLGLTDPDPDLAERVRRLVRLTDSQAIGVDFVRADGEFWAVDVNPAMSFRNAGMEDLLAESVCARLPEALPPEQARA